MPKAKMLEAIKIVPNGKTYDHLHYVYLGMEFKSYITYKYALNFKQWQPLARWQDNWPGRWSRWFSCPLWERKNAKCYCQWTLENKSHLFGGLEATRTFLTMSFENPGVCNSPYYICFPGNAWTLVRTYSSGSLERTWSRQGRQSNSGYRSSAACWSDACGRQWQRSICRAFRRFVCEMMENVHANTSQTRHLLVDPVERIEYTVAPKHDHVKACAPGLYATGINNNLIILISLELQTHLCSHALYSKKYIEVPVINQLQNANCELKFWSSRAKVHKTKIFTKLCGHQFKHTGDIPFISSRIQICQAIRKVKPSNRWGTIAKPSMNSEKVHRTFGLWDTIGAMQP